MIFKHGNVMEINLKNMFLFLLIVLKFCTLELVFYGLNKII